MLNICLIYTSCEVVHTCSNTLKFTIHAVSGEVRQLSSSLDTTNRNHACADELITFVCETTGTMLIWTTDLLAEHRVIFFSDDRVDTVRVTQRQTTRAILLHNDPAPEGGGMRRFTSALLLSIDSSMNSVNVTCSSNTETVSKVFGIAGTIMFMITIIKLLNSLHA